MINLLYVFRMQGFLSDKFFIDVAVFYGLCVRLMYMYNVYKSNIIYNEYIFLIIYGISISR